MPGRQVLKLKAADENRARLSGFHRAAWEARRTGRLRGKAHANAKRQSPRHKRRWESEE